MANTSADRKQNTAADAASGKPIGDVEVYDTGESTVANRTTGPATSTASATRTDTYRAVEPAATTGGSSAMTWVLVLIALAVLAILLWYFVF